MNILRKSRKNRKYGRKKITIKRLIIIIFCFMMTTFAWFTYTKILKPEIDIHIATWNIKFFVDGIEKENPIDIEVNDLYPGMTTQTINIKVQNNGETAVEMYYEIMEVSLLGKKYNVVKQAPADGSQYYILSHDIITSNGQSTFPIIKETNRFPFEIELITNNRLESKDEENLAFTIKWSGNDNVLDPKWGYEVASFYQTLKDAESNGTDPGFTSTSPISLKLKVNAAQVNE